MNSQVLSILKHLFCGIAAVFLVSAGSTIAQQPVSTPKPADDVLRISSSLIQVEAIVKDKNGKVVTDLTRDDFELVESNVSRPVEFFSFVSVNSPRETQDVSVDGRLTRGELRRTFVFVVSNPIIDLLFADANARGMSSNTFSLRPRTLRGSEDTQRFLKKFINEKIGNRDLVSIIDVEADMGVLANFTNDREVLNAAAEKLRKNTGNYSPVRLNIINGDASMRPLIEQNLAAIKSARNAVAELRKLPGRKLVVLLSHGFLDDPRFPGADQVRQNLKELITAANEAQVTFYSLSLHGLGNMGGIRGNSGTPGGFVQAIQDLNGTRDLAEDTGGRTIFNTNDVSIGFDEVLTENEGYYMLAYDPGEEAAAKPHHVSVRVKRPGLTVQTRSAVFGQEPVKESRDPLENILSVLRSPFTATTIKVNLEPAFVQTVNKKGAIKTLIHIDPAGLPVDVLPDGRRAVKFDLAFQVVGPDNKIVRRTVKSYTLKLSDLTWTESQKVGMPYQFAVEIEKPGFYQVNAAVCAGIELCGSASRFVNASIERK